MDFECYRIGDLLLDAGTQEVSRNGTVVPVPRLSFKLLLSLAQHAPNVVSTTQLEKEVWAGLIVDRGTVNKRVLLLRKSLGEDKDGDPYIAVIRGSGYRLIAQVERLDANRQDHHQTKQQKEKEARPQSLYQHSTRVIRTISIWLLGIVAVLALYQGLHDFNTQPERGAILGGPEVESRSLPEFYNKTTVAVLPFIDLSEDETQQYLADGISEEVINLLARMDGLEVAARTSSFAFRETSLNAMEIAQDLKVGTILEGSIRHSGNRIRVTAKLIDTQTGFHIWSKNYDRAFSEVFEVQDDIATHIADSLMLTLEENDQPHSKDANTSDMKAFALYLHGCELLNDRIHLRTAGLLGALEYFQQAVEQDPGFAKAHARIATTYWLLTTYDHNLDKETYFGLVKTSANMALEFDPFSTHALSALALVQSLQGNVEQAAALFEQIRAIGSNDSNIAHWEAMLHIRLGYFDELIDPLKEAYRLDPFNEHIASSLASALNFAGRPVEAAEILHQLEHFSFRQYVLGLTAINRGDYAMARELLRGTRMRSGVLSVDYADMLVDALENPEKVEEVASKFISAAETGALSSGVSFESLLILDSPRAFDLRLEPHLDNTRVQVNAHIWNNWSVGVRRDQRFKDWVEKLGYPEFWRKHAWPDRCRPTSADDFECN